MSSKSQKPEFKRTRHRITEIGLIPTTSNRQISARVLVDDKVICQLPWIKSGRPLRWIKLIVHDGSDDSKVGLDVCEKHSIKDRRFRSNAYIISDVLQQTEVTVVFIGKEWNATFKLLTPAAAEQSFTAGLDRLRELESAPSALQRLGRARPVFEAMLQFGSEISEIYPTAKIMFMICTKTWEKLEAQEQVNEDIRELLESLGGILEFVELVKNHAQTERLRGTVGEFLILLEDVSICAADYAQLTNSPGRTLRGLLEPRENDKTREFLKRFERLRAELTLGIGAETHKQVHAIEKKMHTMDLHGLLGQLQPVTPSGYDPAGACQEGTRQRVIAEILAWGETPMVSECVLWVHGQAGIGKSSIATSICQLLANENVLAASFFCKRDDPALRDPLRIINSLAHGIATRFASYAQAIASAIQEDRELCTSHMDIRYKGLIQKPLRALEDPGMGRPMIVLVDALDECGTYTTRRSLLKYLLDMGSLVPWLKLIITSRSDGDIQEFFQSSNKLPIRSCNVHSFDASDDIRAYMQKELGDIARRHRWDEGAINQLCEKAGGVFVWAATVKNYLTGLRGSTVPRLQKVLNDQKSTVSDHLDTLYRSVILVGMRGGEEDEKALFRQCIGTIAIVSTRQPLSVITLGSLLEGQLDPISLEEVVNSLYAVFHVDEHLDGAVRFYHPSFGDYATDPSRSADLHVSPSERNAELAMGCLKTMERELRFNICALETSYLLNSQVPNLEERIKSNISDQLGYACTYWISHLVDTPKGTLRDEVEALMNSPRVLYWLEALSLLGRVEVGLQGLLDLQEWLPDGADNLLEYVADMYKFISAFYDPITSSTPHIYVSALALAPSSAGLIRRFKNIFPNTVTATKGGDNDWPSWRRTLVHPDGVTSLAVSPNNRLLVTGCSDGAVRFWDIRSGTPVVEPLFSDLGFVRCVAFSPDGSRVVSGHFGRALRLWDVKTGLAIGHTLHGHSNIVYCVAYSPDGQLITSGSVDETIRLWDANTGAAVGDPLIGRSNDMESVAFSPDGSYIVACYSSGWLQIWATTSRTLVDELLIDGLNMSGAAFSGHNSCIVYGTSAGLGTVQWDPNNGTLIGEPVFQEHTYRTSSLTLSPDGRCVAIGTYDNTVHIWDIETGSAIGEPLTGHFEHVMAVAFSSDGHQLASASADKTVRLWEARPRSGLALNEPLAGHSDEVATVGFSPDGSRIVSGSHDKTIRLWDAKAGVSLTDPLVELSDAVAAVAYWPDGNHIVSRTYRKSLQMWDATNGDAIGKAFTIHSDTVRCFALSPDGTHIAFVSSDNVLTVNSVVFTHDQDGLVSSWENLTELWSTATTVISSEQLISHLASTSYLAFSSDGSQIATASDDKTLCLWDAKTGTAVCHPLAGHSHWVSCVAFSPDGKHIVSGSYDNTLRLWDTGLGVTVGEPFVGHSSAIISVAFSPDGTHIASGSRDNTVHLWDSQTGGSIGGPFVCHTSAVSSVAFSPDSRLIVSGSWDTSICVWKVQAEATIDDSNSANTISSQNPSLLTTPASWPPHTYALPPHPEHSGWVSLDGESCLLWLPAHYRREYSPNLLFTISSRPSQSVVQLDLSKFAHGSSWASVTSDKIRQGLV